MRKVGALRGSRIPRTKRETQIELVTDSRWPEAELHSSIRRPAGNHSLGRALSRHRPEALYRLPESVFRRGIAAPPAC
jgi:hypothetical protein